MLSQTGDVNLNKILPPVYLRGVDLEGSSLLSGHLSKQLSGVAGMKPEHHTNYSNSVILYMMMMMMMIYLALKKPMNSYILHTCSA